MMTLCQPGLEAIPSLDQRELVVDSAAGFVMSPGENLIADDPSWAGLT